MTITGTVDLQFLQTAQQIDPADPRHAHIGDDAAPCRVAASASRNAAAEAKAAHLDQRRAQQEGERFAKRRRRRR